MGDCHGFLYGRLAMTKRNPLFSKSNISLKLFQRRGINWEKHYP
jgi:hypothetical protein